MSDEVGAQKVAAEVPAGWVARSGLGGKLIAGGGVLGLVAAFLPLVSVSMNMTGVSLMGGNRTSMVVDDGRGMASLAGYLAALAFALLLYPPDRRPAKGLVWGALGVGAVLAVLGLWLLAAAARSRGGADFMGMMDMRVSLGVGAFVNMAAAAAVAVGAMLKGREERLF